MLLFDIGANRGDVVLAGLKLGYDKIIALEPAPRIFAELVKAFIYNPNVIPLKMAVSDTNDQSIEFYEASEDGLSTINIDWLTKEGMPYKDKEFRTISATTITIDRLVDLYGSPDLIKIDVEGAEWSVLLGMTKKYGILAFEWTDTTLREHDMQLQYLRELGYTEYAPQFIVNHLEEPIEWFSLNEDFSLGLWVLEHEEMWVNGGWKVAGLRPTADVGMVWAK